MKVQIGQRLPPRGASYDQQKNLFLLRNYPQRYGADPDRVRTKRIEKVGEAQCPRCQKTHDLSCTEDIESGSVNFEGPDACQCGHQFEVSENIKNGPKLSQHQIIELFGK